MVVDDRGEGRGLLDLFLERHFWTALYHADSTAFFAHFSQMEMTRSSSSAVDLLIDLNLLEYLGIYFFVLRCCRYFLIIDKSRKVGHFLLLYIMITIL